MQSRLRRRERKAHVQSSQKNKNARRIRIEFNTTSTIVAACAAQGEDMHANARCRSAIRTSNTLCSVKPAQEAILPNNLACEGPWPRVSCWLVIALAEALSSRHAIGARPLSLQARVLSQFSPASRGDINDRSTERESV